VGGEENLIGTPSAAMLRRRAGAEASIAPHTAGRRDVGKLDVFHIGQFLNFMFLGYHAARQ
jgi:hypothetical protein